MDNKVVQISLGLAAIAGVSAALMSSRAGKTEKTPDTPKVGQKKTGEEYDNVIIGDVGGTNVRLQLLRVSHNPTKKSIELKPLTKFKS